MKKALTLLFCLYSFGTIIAGNAAYRKYSLQDGLPNNQILRLWIDSRRYLWGNTWAGGFRFDGNRFYNFRERSDDPILKSRFLYFYEKNSDVIIGTTAGVAFFTKEGIKTYPLPKKHATHYRRINSKLYILINNSIFSFCLEKRSYRNEDNITFSHNINSNQHTKPDDIQKKINAIFHQIIDENTYLNTIIDGSIVKSDDSLQKLNEDQFCKRHTKKELLTYIPMFTDMSTSDIITDKDGVIWAGTEQGLYRIPAPAFINYTKHDGIPNYIWSICEDIDGMLWLATYGNGLFKYDKNEFVKEDIICKYYKQAISNYYLGSAQTSTGFLLPHARGVLRRENNKWSHIEELPKTAYLYIHNDEELNTVFYCGFDTLSIYRKEKWEKYPSTGLLKNCPLDIVKDKKNRYWMGAGSTQSVHIYKDGNFVDVDDDEMMFPGGIYSADRDNEGNLWIGNYDGLYCYSYNNVDTIKIKHKATIVSVKCYKDSIILAGTNKGLHCIDLKKYYTNARDYYTFFSDDMGMDVEDLGQQGIIVDSKEQIWIISSSGITRFYPERVRIPQSIPEPIIYSIKYSSPSLEWEKRDLLFSDLSIPLSFNYPICNIEINFGSIATSIKSGITHSYKIEGYHNEWIRSTTDNRIVITNLSPGKYTFKLRTVQEKDNSIGSEKEFSFMIVPTFWQTLYFKIILAILSLALITLITYFYIRMEKRRLLREMEVTNIQLANIKSQLNPHFIFNTMNSIGADLIDKDSSIYPNYSKLARLIRKNLHDADQSTKPLFSEIEFVQEYLELQKQRFKSKLTYSIMVSNDIDQTMLIPKMAIQILVENAVHHGLAEVSKTGLVTVHVEKESKFTVISVSDNGVGFSKTQSKKGSGTGLKNLRKIIDIYNHYNKEKCILKIKSEENIGTQVFILIPHNYSFIIGKHRNTKKR